VNENGVFISDDRGSVFIASGNDPAVLFSTYGFFGAKGAGLRDDVILKFMHPKWVISSKNGNYSVYTDDYACGLKIKEFLEKPPGRES